MHVCFLLSCNVFLWPFWEDVSVFFQIIWLVSYFSNRSVMSGSILQSQILSGSVFYTLVLSLLLVHLEKKRKAFCSVCSLCIFLWFSTASSNRASSLEYFSYLCSLPEICFSGLSQQLSWLLFSFESLTFPWLLWQPLYNVLWHEQTAGTPTNRKPQKVSSSTVIFVFLALSQLSLLVLSNFAILLTTAPFYCSLYPSTANLYWKAIRFSPHLPQQHNPK